MVIAAWPPAPIRFPPTSPHPAGGICGDGRPVLDPDVMLHLMLGDQWKSLVRVHDLREPPQKLPERGPDISG